MFAVPGWSVSADSLKPEVVSQAEKGADGKAKKRKRRPEGGGRAVTAENVGDLWESVIEGTQKKRQRGSSGGASARRKNGKEDKDDAAYDEGPSKGDTGVAVEESKTDGDLDGEARSKKSKKDKKKKEKKPVDQPSNDTPKTGDASQNGPSSLGNTAPPPPAVSKPATKLTPLQAAMQAKLIPARFRYLNETLYTRPSEESFRLFEETPDLFDQYHAGFRQQVEVWPENPVDGYIEMIRQRGNPGPRNPRGQRANENGSRPPAPLPRTRGICTIADLGCGDAALAQTLTPEKDTLRLSIHSFDLHSPHPLVTRADIANLPLADNSVDIAIFCLALMGTNWPAFIDEAHRILRHKGELWIAEIQSRFAPAGRSRRGPVAHSVGARRNPPPGKKSKGKGEEKDFTNDLVVEVDGEPDHRRETDVSAFVAALERRGFTQTSPVDLTNKMFVRMSFIKTGGPANEAAPPPKPEHGKRKPWPKPSDDEPVDEGTILKPCVYKLR